MLNLTDEQKKQLKELKKNNLFKPYIVLKLLQNNILEMKKKDVKLKDILLILEKKIDFKMHYVSFTQAIKKLNQEYNKKEETKKENPILTETKQEKEMEQEQVGEEYTPLFSMPKSR